jgi:hypothetical protein
MAGPTINTGFPSSQGRHFARCVKVLTPVSTGIIDVTPCGLVFTPTNVRQVTYTLRSRCLQQNMYMLLLLFGINQSLKCYHRVQFVISAVTTLLAGPSRVRLSVGTRFFPSRKLPY